MSAQVHAAREGAILRLILDHPPANALSLAVMESFQANLDDVRSDETVRVVVIASAIALFSGGHDLKEMTAHRDDPDAGRTFFEHTFATCSRLMQSIMDLPQPVIAEVDGTATAAGCQLIASCDLAYASDRARFGVNGIDVGLFCSTPAVALTRTVPIKRAMDMLLTGRMIDAAEALEIGLVNAVVPQSSLRQAVDDAAKTIAAKSAVGIRLGKKLVYEQAGMRLSDAYACASRTIVENMMAADAADGIGAFLGKRRSKPSAD